MKLVQDEVPRHFEALRLRAWVVVGGWPLAGAAAVAGVVLAASAGSPAVEVLGVALTALGAVLIAGLVRCRSFEIVVGARLITIGAGPLRRRLPVGLVTTTETRRARSWRRLYADRELALGLSTAGGAVLVPTADPEALASVVRAARE